jgi:hypothetical protein
MPILTCTPDPTKTKAHRQVVGVEIVEGRAYGEATGLYNKHRKYSEEWNQWHPFQSAHNFQLAQTSSQQTKLWIDQHLRGGLDNFYIKSLQWADALRKLLSEHAFGLCNDSWIEDHLHIFSTLYYRDIFMFTFPFGTSPISDTPQFWSSAQCWQRKSPNIQWDEYKRCVVKYADLAFCRSCNCVHHLCIQQDSLDQIFWRSAGLATVSHNW